MIMLLFFTQSSRWGATSAVMIGSGKKLVKAFFVGAQKIPLSQSICNALILIPAANRIMIIHSPTNNNEAGPFLFYITAPIFHTQEHGVTNWDTFANGLHYEEANSLYPFTKWSKTEGFLYFWFDATSDM